MEYVNSLNMRRRAISRKYSCFPRANSLLKTPVTHAAVGDILV